MQAGAAAHTMVTLNVICQHLVGAAARDCTHTVRIMAHLMQDVRRRQ